MAEEQDDRISSYVNRAGVEEDTKFMVDAIIRVKKSITELEDFKTKLFGGISISDVVKNINAISATVDKMNKEKLKAITIAIAEEKQRLATAKADLEEARAKEKLLLFQERLNKSQNTKPKSSTVGPSSETVVPAGPVNVVDGIFAKLQAAAKEAKKEWNDLMIAQRGGLDVTDSQIDQAKQKWKELQAEIKKVAIANKTAFAPEEAQTKNTRIAQLTGEIATLERRITAAKGLMRDFGKTEGKKSTKYLELGKDVDFLTGKLKVAEKEKASLDAQFRNDQIVNAQSGKAVEQMDKELAAGEKLKSFYAQLQAQLQALQVEAQELASKGLIQGLSDKETKRLADVQVQATNMANAIAKIDVQAGKGARSNLAYTQQLFSLQQVLRETPNIAFGWNIFLASLSNNIPILADDLKRLADRNKELQAAGKPTTSVMSQIGKSLLSVTSLIAISVALFTIFAEKIAKWAVALFRSAEANRQAFLRSKEYFELQKQHADIVGKLIEAYKSLNKIVAESNSAAIRKLKAEIAEMETLGLSADKLFEKKKLLAKLDSEQADKGKQNLAEQLRTQQIRESQAQLNDLDEQKKRLLDELKPVKTFIPSTTGSGGRTVTTEVPKEKRIEVIQKLSVLEQKLSQSRIDFQTQLTNQRLDDETFIARFRARKQNELADLSLRILANENKLREDTERKTLGKSGFSKKQLDALRSEGDALSKDASNAKAFIDGIDEAVQTSEDKKTEIVKIAAEERKFTSDQEREKILSNIQRTQDGVIASNEKIINDDRKGMREKLAAIDKISGAQKNLAVAQRNFEVSDLSVSPAGIVKAENDLTKTLKAIDLDRAEKRQAIRDEFLERDLHAIEENFAEQKRMTEQFNDQVAQNIEASFSAGRRPLMTTKKLNAKSWMLVSLINCNSTALPKKKWEHSLPPAKLK